MLDVEDQLRGKKRKGRNGRDAVGKKRENGEGVCVEGVSGNLRGLLLGEKESPTWEKNLQVAGKKTREGRGGEGERSTVGGRSGAMRGSGRTTSGFNGGGEGSPSAGQEQPPSIHRWVAACARSDSGRKELNPRAVEGVGGARSGGRKSTDLRLTVRKKAMHSTKEDVASRDKGNAKQDQLEG